MSSHNTKKRKRPDVNKPQVISNQENNRAGHVPSDSSPLPLVASSSNVSAQLQPVVSGANKRFCSGAGSVPGRGGDVRRDVAVEIQNAPVHPNRDDFAAKRRAEALKMALARINELQDELLGLSDESDDEYGSGWTGETPEMLGYAVCVQETLAFLAAQGLDGDNPMIVNLKNSLVEAMPL